MAKDPQYGVPITPSEASLGLPFNPMYGVTPSNEYIPVQVNAEGVLSSNVIIEGITVSLGQIEIKDGSSSFLATVDSTGHLYTLSVLADGTNTPYSASNPLRVDPTGTTPQPVTQSGSWTVSLTSGSIEIGTVDQGTPNTLANAWPVEITDGINILGTSLNPVKIDPTGTTIQPVSGTGSFTVVQTTGTNLHTVVDSGSIVATPPALPAAANFGQAVVATTGTAVQLGSGVLVNGVVVSANTSNTASIVVGLSGVTNTTNGTGNGYVLAPGASIGIAVLNTNALWVNGTSGDVVSYVGS